MRVVQFTDYGGPEVLHEAEVPTPEPSEGAVRIRVRAAAVNPADPKIRSGMFKDFSPLTFPHVVGYDVAGEVDAIGKGGGGLQVGDRVVARLDPETKGGYAEYAVVPASDAVEIPAGLDFATAGAIPTPGLTGVQMVEVHATPGRGDLVLVSGATGAVGRFAVYAARQRGARVVAAVRRAQVDEARAQGAEQTVILGEDEWSGEPFSYVLDTVGGAAVGELCRHLAAGGKIFTAATNPIPAEGLAVQPVFIAVESDLKRLTELAKAVAAGEIKVSVSKRLPLSQAAEAHRLLEANASGGKIILEP